MITRIIEIETKENHFYLIETQDGRITQESDVMHANGEFARMAREFIVENAHLNKLDLMFGTDITTWIWG